MIYRPLLLAAALAVASPVHATHAASLDFDRTFTNNADRGRAYFAATYITGGQTHRVEVWRDGDTRLKRVTDDALETHLERPSGAVEWRMTILDRRRKIRTDIDRTNLMRIGHVVDWFSEAHALVRPRGSYRLIALHAAPAGITPVAPCDWYLLTDGERRSAICWSAAAHVPLAIVGDAGVAWRVDRLRLSSLPPRVFDVDDRGYVRNDANRDIGDD